MILGSVKASATYDSSKNICGPVDNRQLHFDSRIGRISSNESPYKCTLTLISKNCAISAGHCVPLLKYVEFNVPLTLNGIPQVSLPEDIYYPDPSFLMFKNRSTSGDWAVFKLTKNLVSKAFPGDRYGFYNVNFKKPTLNDSIYFAGYGSDQTDGTRHFSLKKVEGKILSFEDNAPVEVIRHNLDSESGDSGSSIFTKEDQQIVGIHIGGGCSGIDNDTVNLNRGTLIAAHPDLQEAIVKCLEDE